MKVGAKFMRVRWAGIAVLAVAGIAFGQSDSVAPPSGRPGHHGGFGPMSDDAMGFVGFEAGLGGKTVTGAPFSASFSTQTTQTLADGNQIQRTTSGTFVRDSQGRTRRDLTLPAVGAWATSGQAAPHAVVINDSVAGTQYILEPERKIARKRARPAFGKHGGAGAAPDAQFAPRTGPRDNRNNVVTTSLGTQTINGVQAEGTRTTRTIPAGAIGNANPIVITSERWYSPELQTVVMIKHSDPRMGETTFQLTNVQRQEPDASLFQVPADYTVKQGGNRRFGRRLPPSPDASPAQPPSQD